MSSGGRRASFNWISAVDEGDAVIASAEIGAWLRDGDDHRKDWETVSTAMRDRLTLLVINPVIRSDPEACRIIERFVDCADFEEIDRVCDALADRVRHLLAKRTPAARSPTRPDGLVASQEFQGATTRSRIRI